jgi:hypothetical protein
MMLLPLLPGCASQPLPPLPGFGGLAFFQAAAAQQCCGRGSLLPEPPPPEPCAHAFSEAAAAPAGRTTKEGWWDQAHTLASELGVPVEQQPLAAVGVPRALKKLKKQAFAALRRHVEPQALPVSASSAHDDSVQRPRLQEIACKHYADFCADGSAADGSGRYGSGALLLDEPIFLAADSCWPEQGGQQVRGHPA